MPAVHETEVAALVVEPGQGAPVLGKAEESRVPLLLTEDRPVGQVVQVEDWPGPNPATQYHHLQHLELDNLFLPPPVPGWWLGRGEERAVTVPHHQHLTAGHVTEPHRAGDPLLPPLLAPHHLSSLSREGGVPRVEGETVSCLEAVPGVGRESPLSWSVGSGETRQGALGWR